MFTDNIEYTLKETATLMTSMFYKKGLYKPWMLIPVLSKSVQKCGSWEFEYLQMDCNGSGHIVG